MNQNVMIAQWILQEIFCWSIHPYAGLCPAHIDIIRISEELSRQDKKDIMSIGGD